MGPPPEPHQVITREKAESILRAAGIVLEGGDLSMAAQYLNEIARSLITNRHMARKDERGRTRTTLGSAARLELFGNLVGAWIDYPGVHRLPGVTYNDITGRYSGPFVTYLQGFCSAVAFYIKQQIAGDAHRQEAWRGVVRSLENIARNGVHVRDGLRMLGIQRLKANPSKFPH